MSFIGEAIRSLGVLDGCLYLLSRSLERATRGRFLLVKYLFYAQPVPEAALMAARASASMEIVQLDAADPRVEWIPRPPRVLAARFAQHAVCLAALRSGKLAGCLWLVHEQYEEDEVRCRYLLEPREQAVWDFDVYVAPSHRNSRAFARLWESANAYLRDRGVKWSLSRISAFNAGSIRAHERMGAMRIGWAVFVRLGGCQLSVMPQPPRVHLSMKPADRPTLLLRAPATAVASGRG